MFDSAEAELTSPVGIAPGVAALHANHNSASAKETVVPATIGGYVYADPVLARHDDGHLEVFVVGLDGCLWRKHQAGRNQGFVQDWTPMDPRDDIRFDPLTTRPALGYRWVADDSFRSNRARPYRIHVHRQLQRWVVKLEDSIGV